MLLALVGATSAWADYAVDFDTSITTSNHDFAVAEKWKHIVQDNDGYYVGYKWDAAYGVNGTGGLLVYSQKVGSSNWDMATVYDLLVTPKVSGTIKLKVKAYENASSSTKAFVQLWSVNGTATEKGTQLKEFQTEIPGYNTGSSTEWVELTYDVTEAQRIGIRAQYVYIDDFSADAIDTTPEAALTVSSVMNSDGQTGTNGTNPQFEQQSDGNMKVVLKVTLANTGDVDFVAGTTENYTLTLAQASYTSGTKTYYEDASIAIPEDIAAGETKTFDVEFTIPYLSGYKYWYVRENVTGTTSSTYRYATSVAYESKFVLRIAESGSTSDLTTAQDYGRVSSATTRSFEIYNDGTAPLVIKGITLPEGFTSDNLPVIPTEGLVLAKKSSTGAFNVTLPVTTTGDFSGNLVISYVKAGDAEATNKTLAFSGTVLAEGTWFADFNGDKSSSSAGVYPEGSVVTSSTTLQFGYTGSYGSYDHYLKPYSSAGMLVMPKLTATAGAQLKYDAVKYQSGSSYNLKVYVSTDRETWGEPVATINNSDLETSGQRYSQTLTFDEAGDYYVAFELYGVGLDNVIGLTKTAVAHDLYFKKTSLVAEAQTGKEIKPSVQVVPLTAEAADGYTVKYYVDGVAVAEGTAVAMEVSATSDKTFTISYTPTDEVTTEHDSYIEFEFTDGTKIASKHQTLKVTNEPKFLFVAASTSVSQYTTNLTTAQAFGKVNVATESKNFKIYNQGTAPLNVTSIVAPEGFSVNKTEAVVAAGESEDIVVTFSAITPGEYAGNLVVNYTQDGAQTFELAFSGTMLDQTKWYANFDNASKSEIVWPAGSVYESSVNTSYNGWGPYNYYIYSRSSSNNKFTTPKLTAAAGDVFHFDARAYSSYYSNGTIKVYASATRSELGDAIAELSVTDYSNWATQDVTITTAGDYFITLEFENVQIDELYGLSLTSVAHDWQIVSSNIPAEAMQNVASTATVNVANFGVKDEAAEDIQVIAYLNGEAVATAEGVAIPMSHQLSAAGTQLSVSFRSPKAGTFPVYVEVKAGDYSVATDPVDVAFAGEVATAEGKQVGTQTGTARDYGFVDWYNTDGSGTRYTDILYPAAKIQAAGINAGDKITAISFKASNSAKTFKAEVTSWVGTSTGDITYGTPDKADMQEITVYTGSVEFPANAESVITLTEPIVWDGTSDIRVYTEAVGQGSGNWMSATYAYDSDITMSYNGTTKAAPLAYFTLAVESAVISGTVKNAADEAIEGATITLVSTDGDNIQYEGTTDSEGAYSINVIQSSREYNVTVVAGDSYKEASATVDFTEGNVVKNFVLAVNPLIEKYFVNTDLASTEGWTAVTSAQYAELGNGLIGTYKLSASSNIAVSTADDAHLATEYAFGIECRWSTNFASYTQESKIELPAGVYALTYDVENTNGSTTSASYENRFTVTVGENVYTDKSTEWMSGKSSWTTHSIQFTVPEDAKATISFGYGTGSNNIGSNNTPGLYVSHLGLTFVKTLYADAIDELVAEITAAEALKTAARTEGLDEFIAAIAAAEALKTSTDVATINAGIETLKAAETAFLTANLPVAEGTYYVYNPMTKKFLSRGNAYGTAAVVDDYGVAVNVSYSVELPNVKYTLSSFDNGKNYGFDAWMYADAGGNDVRSYIFTAVEGGYTVTNTTNNMLMYVYTKEDGNKFRVAGNAIKDDNYTDDAQTVWQFVTPADRDAMVADREAAAEAAAFASAGIDEGAMLAEAEATEVSFTSGNAWTQTVVRTQDNQPATNANGTEMWQATGNYTQTIADLPAGLYNVSIQAFYRNGNADEDQARVATGYNTVLAYLEANGNKVQVKSWSSDKGDGNDPNSMKEAKDKFDEDKYLSEVYTFVGEDGKLNLTVNNPAHIGNGWFIVGNVKYAKVEELVELTDEDTGVGMKSHVTVAVERNFKAGWNAVILPFAITADEIKAQFGENTEVAACDGYELSPDEKNVIVKFKKVDAMEINTPYLLWLDNAIDATVDPLFFYTKEVYGDYYKSENTYFNVIGVYQPTVVNAGDLFMQGGKFVKATENNTVLPYRFYLEVAEGAELTVKVDGDLLTGVNGIFANESEQSIYNLSGQRVQKAQKGIYIVNGKKALVK